MKNLKCGEDKIQLKTFKLLICLILSIWTNSCQDKSICHAINAYENHRSEILNLFLDHNIYRRDKLFTVEIYKDSSIKKYGFVPRGDVDSMSLKLEYFVLGEDRDITPDSIKYYENYVTKLVAKMNSLNIRSITSEFSYAGINLKLYFEDNSRLLYIKDITKVKNKQWISYINKAKKLDTYWFFHLTNEHD